VPFAQDFRGAPVDFLVRAIDEEAIVFFRGDGTDPLHQVRARHAPDPLAMKQRHRLDHADAVGDEQRCAIEKFL
jgi:hypothetical protein